MKLEQYPQFEIEVPEFLIFDFFICCIFELSKFRHFKILKLWNFRIVTF